jgi:protein-tyrosine-phosphatase
MCSKRYAALSAGIRPSGEINPLAVQVMKEYDIDISKQKPKIIIEDKRCHYSGKYGMYR